MQARFNTKSRQDHGGYWSSIGRSSEWIDIRTRNCHFRWGMKTIWRKEKRRMFSWKRRRYWMNRRKDIVKDLLDIIVRPLSQLILPSIFLLFRYDYFSLTNEYRENKLELVWSFFEFPPSKLGCDLSFSHEFEWSRETSLVTFTD